VSIQDFLNAVANTEVGAVHVTSDDEDHRNRQVVVGHIRQPERLGLRMEPAQEGQDRRPSAVGGAEHMAAGVRVLRIDAPVPGEERHQTFGVRLHRQEVIPTHMLTPEIREWRRVPGDRSRPGS
jgi:hypothetical protein